jgi:hypothetical protein
MPETKNVLELMTEMLQEQDNYRNNCANNGSNSRRGSLSSDKKNLLNNDQELVVNENKVPSLKFHQQKGNSPNSRTNNGNSSNKYETSRHTERNTDRTTVSQQKRGFSREFQIVKFVFLNRVEMLTVIPEIKNSCNPD